MSVRHPKDAKKTGDRRNVVGRVSRFLKEVRAELRKVAWPNRRETVVFTSVVIVAVIIVAAVIWVMDVVFTQALTLLFR